MAWIKRQASAAAALVADHDRRPFDIMHGFWTDGGGIVAWLVQLRRQIPSMVTVMAGELTCDPVTGYGKRDLPVTGRLARHGARKADLLHVLSAFHARVIADQDKKLVAHVQPFGTDLMRFAPSGNARKLQGEVPILIAASLVPVKNHVGLFESFASALRHQPGLHLHVFGRGALEPTLQRQVLKNALANSVTFHGHVDHGQLPTYYRGARFCVLASGFESQGMVALEAAACDRVTIGTAVGAMPELCPPEYLVSPGDIYGLAAIITKLAGDTELQQSLGARARQRLSDGMTLSQSIEGLEGLYVRTIAKVAGSR